MFTKVEITKSSRSELLTWCESVMGAPYRTVIAEHMTIKFGGSAEKLPVGSFVSLQVVGFGMDNLCQAVVVTCRRVPSENKIPHITISVNNCAPKYSNQLLANGWNRSVNGPILIGVVQSHFALPIDDKFAAMVRRIDSELPNSSQEVHLLGTSCEEGSKSPEIASSDIVSKSDMLYEKITTVLKGYPPSDITIIFGHQYSLRLHRFALSTVSPYFRDLLHEGADSLPSQVTTLRKELTIEDIGFDVSIALEIILLLYSRTSLVEVVDEYTRDWAISNEHIRLAFKWEIRPMMRQVVNMFSSLLNEKKLTCEMWNDNKELIWPSMSKKDQNIFTSAMDEQRWISFLGNSIKKSNEEAKIQSNSNVLSDFDFALTMIEREKKHARLTKQLLTSRERQLECEKQYTAALKSYYEMTSPPCREICSLWTGQGTDAQLEIPLPPSSEIQVSTKSNSDEDDDAFCALWSEKLKISINDMQDTEAQIHTMEEECFIPRKNSVNAVAMLMLDTYHSVLEKSSDAIAATEISLVTETKEEIKSNMDAVLKPLLSDDDLEIARRLLQDRNVDGRKVFKALRDVGIVLDSSFYEELIVSNNTSKDYYSYSYTGTGVHTYHQPNVHIEDVEVDYDDEVDDFGSWY